MERLDSRSKYPSDLEEYLGTYGMHFNKKLYHFAVSMMKNHKGETMQPWDLDRVDEFLKFNGVSVKNKVGYDVAYVLTMGLADYFGSSIPDDKHLALFAQDYCDDPDGSPTRAFDEFIAKCVALGEPVFWSEML